MKRFADALVHKIDPHWGIEQLQVQNEDVKLEKEYKKTTELTRDRLLEYEAFDDAVLVEIPRFCVALVPLIHYRRLTLRPELAWLCGESHETASQLNNISYMPLSRDEKNNFLNATIDQFFVSN